MGLAGYIGDGSKFFPIMWVCHLLVALPYVLCTFTIPIAMYSDDGGQCRSLGGSLLYPLKPVYWTHCGLFLVYVWMMLSITYFSAAKSIFYPELYNKVTETNTSQSINQSIKQTINQPKAN